MEVTIRSNVVPDNVFPPLSPESPRALPELCQLLIGKNRLPSSFSPASLLSRAYAMLFRHNVDLIDECNREPDTMSTGYIDNVGILTWANRYAGHHLALLARGLGTSRCATLVGWPA